jgi:hypothetical protein
MRESSSFAVAASARVIGDASEPTTITIATHFFIAATPTPS